jgi:hypothetical protein
VWAELDMGKAFKTLQERDRLLDAACPQLSVVVQSSARGNVHVYAAIRGGCATDTDAARRRVRSLNIRFRTAIEHTGKRLFGRPLILDPVHDLARVLRLPGTFNRKRHPAEPVTLLLNQPTYEYTIAEFERILPPLFESTSRARQASKGGGAPSRGATADLSLIPDGRRNTTLYRVAEERLFRGDNPRKVLMFMHWLNAKRCKPPLEDDEVVRIVKSAMKHRLNKEGL